VRLERRALQAAVVVAACVPVVGGLWGVLGGIDTVGVVAASHTRYLSGLLLGIGLAFWTCVPTLERRGPEVRVLSAIVVLGGVARLAGAITHTGFAPTVVWPLVMELVVTPALAIWRERVERQDFSSGHPDESRNPS
jgi:hypothetical protein